jgi:hypothetical protein
VLVLGPTFYQSTQSLLEIWRKIGEMEENGKMERFTGETYS